MARDLAPFDPINQTAIIDALDKEMAMLGCLIRHPGVIVGSVNKIIRLGERGAIPQIIDILK